MEETISKVMEKEHTRLFKILDEAESLIKTDNEKAKQVFNRFKWNMEKHLFTEEKAIFNHEDLMSGEIINDLFSLLREHGAILGLINHIENNFPEESTEGFSNLKNICKLHEKIENEVFYPRLDEELNIEDKREIIAKVNEILVG